MIHVLTIHTARAIKTGMGAAAGTIRADQVRAIEKLAAAVRDQHRQYDVRFVLLRQTCGPCQDTFVVARG